MLKKTNNFRLTTYVENNINDVSQCRNNLAETKYCIVDIIPNIFGILPNIFGLIKSNLIKAIFSAPLSQ